MLIGSVRVVVIHCTNFQMNLFDPVCVLTLLPMLTHRKFSSPCHNCSLWQSISISKHSLYLSHFSLSFPDHCSFVNDILRPLQSEQFFFFLYFYQNYLYLLSKYNILDSHWGRLHCRNRSTSIVNVFSCQKIFHSQWVFHCVISIG